MENHTRSLRFSTYSSSYYLRRPYTKDALHIHTHDTMSEVFRVVAVMAITVFYYYDNDHHVQAIRVMVFIQIGTKKIQ